jgi:TonB-linked SusC/RagA family outer membrane protein
MLIVTGIALAQRTISGKVTDAEGKALPGASVQIQGSQTGTVTRDDGTFTLTIPSNARVLIVSSVGRRTQEIAIGNRTTIDVVLQQGADSNLQEVVVVGYGTQRRREITGNVATIKGEAVEDRPVQSFEQALAGRAAGVQITVPNGLLNNPPVFRIRGTNSISLSSYPLVVIDGVPTYTENALSVVGAPANPLASINPNDIESIDIAKDAAASAIYGSRAANGVVFITTKKGKAGRARVSYDGWVGANKAMRLPEVMNASQYVAYKNVALANAKANNPTITGSFIIPTDANGNPINTNWMDQVYRTGFSHSHNVSVSGGSEGTTYYFSGGYTDQEGIVKRNDFERVNAMLNVDSRINKVLTIGGKLSYSNEKNFTGGSTGSLPGELFASAGAARLAFALPPNVAPYNNNGTYNTGSATAIGGMGNLVNGANPFTFNNVTMVMNLNRSNNEVNHVQSNAYLQLKPFNWLTLRTNYGVDNFLIDVDIFYNPYHGDGAQTGNWGPGGGAAGAYTKNKTWLWTNTAQFDYSLNERNNFSLLVGNEQQRRTQIGAGIRRLGLSDSAYNNVQAGFTTENINNALRFENYLLSLFGRLNYNFNQKYFLSANIRQDEYSALGIKKGIFWGVSAGWEITKEGFWASANLDRVFSSFRIRGSYGKVGNIGGIGTSSTVSTSYPAFSSYTSSLYGGVPTLQFNSVGNPEITWETSTKTDVGFSFGLFNNRLTGDFAYYKNDIYNLLLNVPQSPSAGLPSPTVGVAGSLLQNIGKMYNKGVEFSLTGSPISNKNFSWTSSFNISYNRNEVTALAPGLTQILFASDLETVNKTTVGQPVGYLWAVRTGGVDPGTGRRIFINAAGQPIHYEFGTMPSGKFNWQTATGTRYEKLNPDGSVTPLQINWADDAIAYANPHPRILGGWDNSFRIRDFDVNVLLTYQAGFSVYYGSNAGLHDQRFWNNDVNILDYWQKNGDDAQWPKPVYGDNVSNGTTMPLDINVFRGDFVKLKNVTIGYNLPKNILSRVNILNARFYVSGQNLAIITKYPGPDPEVSSNGNGNVVNQGLGSGNLNPGVDRNTLPNGRTITVGLNLNF